MQLSVTLPTPTHPDLFDSYATWLLSPELAFSSWLAHQNLEESSKLVYQTMFHKFAAHMAERKIPLDHWDSHHLAAFLDGNDLEKRHRYAYVRLIERAFNHLTTLGHRGANPGSKAAKEKVGNGHDDPTRFLTTTEQQALVAHIQTRLDEIRKAKVRQAWTEFRDIALVAAMLGGGLKVAQAQDMTLNCTEATEGWFLFGRTRRDRAHRARILPFAKEVLAAWIAERRELALPGTLLFPANRERQGFKPKGKSATDAMHAASIFRRAQNVLAEVGITGERACAQTLRNTYAASLIEDGASADLLMEYLGLFDERSALRLRASYKQWKTRQGEKATNATEESGHHAPT